MIYPPTVVAANEDIDVSLDIERILARREQERLSSYKLLQALSHQTHLLSDGRLCLDSFRSPDDLTLPLCRLKSGGHRMSIHCLVAAWAGVGSTVFIVAISDRSSKRAAQVRVWVET